MIVKRPIWSKLIWGYVKSHGHTFLLSYGRKLQYGMASFQGVGYSHIVLYGMVRLWPNSYGIWYSHTHTSLIPFCWTYPYDLGLLVSFRATSVIWDLPVRFEGYQCDLRYTCAIWDILAKLHNHAINRKPHTGIWETCVIWPISNFASGYLAETSGYLSLLVWYCQNNPRGKPLGLFCWNDLVDPK